MTNVILKIHAHLFFFFKPVTIIDYHCFLGQLLHFYVPSGNYEDF